MRWIQKPVVCSSHRRHFLTREMLMSPVRRRRIDGVLACACCATANLLIEQGGHRIPHTICISIITSILCDATYLLFSAIADVHFPLYISHSTHGVSQLCWFFSVKAIYRQSTHFCKLFRCVGQNGMSDNHHFIDSSRKRRAILSQIDLEPVSGCDADVYFHLIT